MKDSPLIEPEIASYVRKLVNEFALIESLWLFGSRANKRARHDSDWDFLAFANPNVIFSLRSNPALRRDDVDLFVVIDGNRFESPWRRFTGKPGYLGGTLLELCWNILDTSNATYRRYDRNTGLPETFSATMLFQRK